MSKYRYSPAEQEINNVLKYQDNTLKEIKARRTDSSELERMIQESENLLRMHGYDLPSVLNTRSETRKLMVVPSWDSLCAEAEASVGTRVTLEDLFSAEELKTNENAIRRLNQEYGQLYHLDKYDISISAAAGVLGAVIDILLVGIPKKTPEGLKGAPLSNYVRDYFNRKYPEEEMTKLANSKVSKVPYDAQDNRNTKINVEGLSAYYHRLLSLGHDPLLGFIYGVADILNGRMTTIDKNGRIRSQVIKAYADRKEADIFAAISKQILHLKSDITTSMGLPAPLMGLFNLLQFGSIGEEEQTIAEIVQGMYYEGYDFIHFCSLSIPVMIVEAVTRIAYGIKRLKEGHSLKDSIPVSADRTKHPKLETMLFIAHAAATAANTGKIYFTKNPMAINYPQWLAFAKYSYQQVKWVVLQKPAARDAYVQGVLYEELDEVLRSANETFDAFSKEYILVFE